LLPFLKRQKEVSANGDDEPIVREPDGEEEYDPMHSAADDLISAVHSKDTKAVAEAWRAGHQLLNSEPQDEDEHE
jgi:hypothetical protein